MPNLFRRRSDSANWPLWLFGAPTALAVVFLSYLILRPDPAATNFYRAQQLQTAGQSNSALRLYSILVSSSPQSSFAPLALEQTGEILTALARRSGDTSQMKEAISAYARLSREYSTHSSAGEALLAAGSLAAGDLRDGKAASGFYQTLLENYAGNPDYASEALLRLGRIALQSGDGSLSQNYFTRVLNEHSRFPERCAEAQYHAGVAFETLLKNKTQARAAYETTIKKWPRSVWASDAKERLGMLLYAGASGLRPARRVLLEIGSLPQVGGDSRLAALKLLLAARGLEISDAVFTGWSLSPFRVGFAPENPSRSLDGSTDFSNIAANTGLVFSRKQGDDGARALNELKDELDAGHAPFVSFDGWYFVVGYDSSRDEMTLQKPGGERENSKQKEFVSRWRKSDFEWLSFHAPGETLHPSIEPKPAAIAAIAPDLSAPLYLYKLPNLSLKNAHRRTLRRAAALLKRPREGAVLLNQEALRALALELEKLSAAPVSPVPAIESETPTPDGSTPEAAATPAPSIENDSGAIQRQSKRWNSLRAWFGAPLKNWIEARRDAGAFLDIAANDLSDARLQRAAEELRSAMSHLEAAATSIPGADAFSSDADAARSALAFSAREIKAAHDAEKRASALMIAAS